jgi:hypothetical protein
MCDTLIVGRFFFSENTVTGVTYLDMLEAFCFPQLYGTQNVNNMFQQCCSDALNDKFP